MGVSALSHATYGGLVVVVVVAGDLLLHPHHDGAVSEIDGECQAAA